MSPSTRACSPPTPPRWCPAPTSSSKVIGGIEPTRDLVAVGDGKRRFGRLRQQRRCSPRTALYAASDRHGVDLYYEAAVAGAIPVCDRIRDFPRWGSHHQGHRHRQRHDQLRPRQDGLDRGRVRRRPSRSVLGYAEADPADVEGFDAAAKAAILASLGLPHSCRHPPRSITRESPRSLPRTSPQRTRWARSSNCWRSASG